MSSYVSEIIASGVLTKDTNFIAATSDRNCVSIKLASCFTGIGTLKTNLCVSVLSAISKKEADMKATYGGLGTGSVKVFIAANGSNKLNCIVMDSFSNASLLSSQRVISP